MTVKKVRVHTCSQRIEGFIEKPCTCRRYVTHEEAQAFVDEGSADYIKTDYKVILVDAKCPMCDGTGLKKGCRVCGETGRVTIEKDVFTYGEDVYRTAAKKTPRTATIESNHLYYAYVKLDRDAAKRIELYNELNQLALVGLGAELRDSKGEIIIKGTPEPPDDPKTGTGRNIDYGRTI